MEKEKDFFSPAISEEKKEKKMMKVVCAWCKKELGEKESDIGGVSHGICSECSKKFREEAAEFKKTRNREEEKE